MLSSESSGCLKEPFGPEILPASRVSCGAHRSLQMGTPIWSSSVVWRSGVSAKGMPDCGVTASDW